MSCMSKIKKVSCFGFFLILLTHLNCPLVAEENATEKKSLRLVTEIKQELKELERIQKDISSKFPLRSRFELKYPIFSSIDSFFKKDCKNYDEYFKTLAPSLREDFWDYVGLLMKEAWNRQLSSNNEIIEMMEALKRDSSDDETYLAFIKFYDGLKNNPFDSEENKRQMLREKINIPAPVVDYWMTYPRYQGLFEFYSTVIRIIDNPVDKQRRKIVPLLKELTVSNKNESDRMVQEEVDAFIKEAWGVFPVPPQVPNAETSHYSIIKLFSESMQSPQKREDIKKALQKSKLMRKGVVSLIIGTRYGNHKNIDKIVEKFDYDNFDRYWADLQEISKGLTEEIFPGDKSSPSKAQATMGKCYLECFFTPYLVLDNP